MNLPRNRYTSHIMPCVSGNASRIETARAGQLSLAHFFWLFGSVCSRLLKQSSSNLLLGILPLLRLPDGNLPQPLVEWGNFPSLRQREDRCPLQWSIEAPHRQILHRRVDTAHERQRADHDRQSSKRSWMVTKRRRSSLSLDRRSIPARRDFSASKRSFSTAASLSK